MQAKTELLEFSFKQKKKKCFILVQNDDGKSNL